MVILFLAMAFGGAGGYFLTNSLLDEIYVQRIDINIFAVIACGLMVFGIGIGTTSTTIFRAAKANPVETLRDE
jgi:hypothetical protein